MYPDGFGTTVTLTGPAKVDLEDHFARRILPAWRPSVETAQSGAGRLRHSARRDYQQLRVITRMACDLDIRPRSSAQRRCARGGRPRYVLAQRLPQTLTSVRAAPAMYRALNHAAAKIREGEVVGHEMTEAREMLVEAICHRLYRGALRRDVWSVLRAAPTDRSGCSAAAKLGWHLADRQYRGVTIRPRLLPGRAGRRLVISWRWRRGRSALPARAQSARRARGGGDPPARRIRSRPRPASFAAAGRPPGGRRRSGADGLGIGHAFRNWRDG